MPDRSCREKRTGLIIASLKRETAACRPAFSDSLHRRIMSAIESRSCSSAAPGRAAPNRRLARGILAIVVAATVLLALGPTLLWRPGSREDGLAGRALKPHAASDRRVAARSAGPLHRWGAEDRPIATLSVEQQQLAEFDHDVRLLTELIVDPFPRYSLDVSQN